jgi:hypothetical protein
MRITAGFSATGIALMLLGGCASQPAVVANHAAATPVEACEVVTGSRIRAQDRVGCSPVGYPFKSISVDSLEATGQINLVEALRALDPAFR